MKKYILPIVLVIMLTLVTACGQSNSTAAPAQNGQAEKSEETVQSGDTAKAADNMQGAETAVAGDTANTAETVQTAEAAQTGETAQADETAQAAEAAPDGDTAQAAGSTSIANPWRDITEAEARALYPDIFVVPAGAENAVWSTLDAPTEPDEAAGPLVQLDFDLDGNSFTAREQRTGSKDVDQSGMYYEWTNREESVLQNGNGGGIPCILYRFIGEDETADLCTWYDEESGVSYSLSVVAEDLDGFDLRAVAESIIAPDVPPIEEQRRILEENRSHWTFDEEDYTPDWYYAFTDLDHNGLLEVLAASTQGSGMFTYVHFYEVLPDGSGVRNLCQADEETDGPDAWPEIVLDSIPCYYDSSSDRYYYVCTDVFRDGAAHSKANPITEEEYNKAVENRFGGMEQSELKPEWNAIEASEDLG